MRSILLAMLISVTPAVACDAEFLEIDNWDITEVREGGTVRVNVAFDYRLTGDKPVRMINATVTFTDPFDWRMASVPVPRAQPIQPEKTERYSGDHASGALLIAAKMSHEDIRVASCVKSVVFDDGTKVDF